jgi:hypothetical protein
MSVESINKFPEKFEYHNFKYVQSHVINNKKKHRNNPLLVWKINVQKIFYLFLNEFLEFLVCEIKYLKSPNTNYGAR